MLSLEKELEFNSFQKLILECFKRADIFSLTQNDSLHQKVLGELAPFLIKEIKVQHWFCYYVPQGYEKNVFLFRAALETRKIILSNYHSLFFKDSEKWELPEDLCFFKNNRLLLGTVTHEDICYAYPDTREFADFLKQIGNWRELPDNYEEMITLDI